MQRMVALQLFMARTGTGKNQNSNRWDEARELRGYDVSELANSRAVWEIAVTDVEKVLGSVAAQVMSGEEVVVDGQKIRVRRVGSGRLRMVQFRFDGRVFEAIEQNPEKPSRWGQLAREKRQVVQFRDVVTHKYVAVAVDGEVREY